MPYLTHNSKTWISQFRTGLGTQNSETRVTRVGPVTWKSEDRIKGVVIHNSELGTKRSESYHVKWHLEIGARNSVKGYVEPGAQRLGTRKS